MLGLALCQTLNWREVVGLLSASLFAESRESQWNENVALYVQLIQNTEACKLQSFMRVNIQTPMTLSY